MTTRNHRTLQNILILFTIRAWLFLLALLTSKDPHACLAFPNFNGSVNELKDTGPIKDWCKKSHEENHRVLLCMVFYILDDGCLWGDNCESYDVDRIESSQPCRFFKSSRRLTCKGSIDYGYLQGIRGEKITDFIVENYEIEPLYRRKYWSTKNLETGEWYLKLPKLYQKLTGELQIKDTGLQIIINVRLLPRKETNQYTIEGEAFSNKVIKVAWKLQGNLSFDFIKEKAVIHLDVGATGYGSWKLQTNVTFLKRAAESESDGWKAVGIIKSDSISETQFLMFKGAIWTKMMKEECKFSGDINLQNINLGVAFFGNVSPPQKKQITIPKSAFSSMTIQNMVFKESNFYNDFDKNSFDGLRGLRRISFMESKLESLPRLDELFQSFSDLEEIDIEECTAPRIKFGVLAALTNVKRLNFKGSGPFTFDDASFLWLKKSNLTVLNLRNSHVKILPATNSVLWSVNSTLKHLDVSHSTLNGEKDLMQILKYLNIERLIAEGLKLKKIPVNALESVRKTLTYLSLRENDFKKNFDRSLFESILNFPCMPKLVELNLEECHISYIEKGTFDNLPNLKILHLSYNNLENIQDGWTYTVPQVTHLGLTHNGFRPQVSSVAVYDKGGSMNLSKFKNLNTLDLSDGVFTNINKLINSLGPSLRNLTLRNTRLEDLPEDVFENLTNLEFLDLSFNRNLKAVQPLSFKLFKNLKNLKSLNLQLCRISGASLFKNDTLDNNPEDFCLENLQSLDLSVNNIKLLDPNTLKPFPNLKILNLSKNGISDWNSMTSFNKHLEVLFLDENKIEFITNETLSEIKRLRHIKLGNNPFVCGPYVYEILKIVNTEMRRPLQYEFGDGSDQNNSSYSEESDFIKKLFYYSKKSQVINNAKFLDWSDNNYICFSWSQAKFISFTQLTEDFAGSPRKDPEKIEATLLCLVGIIVVGIVITVAIICWKFLDIHLITRAVRNAVALSFIGRNEKGPATFKYNVFVSYSDQDRSWVVENLLPRLESRSEVKVCLHERDFQVGLSIIENILNSIDSSRNIILVVSQAFLKSQWCQYEMQLAQFRLLEKGRDQLVLIFLENIPLVKRPKTLKYLMMTKTYLEWPSNSKNAKEIDNFWDRLMKSMVNLN